MRFKDNEKDAPGIESSEKNRVRGIKYEAARREPIPVELVFTRRSERDEVSSPNRVPASAPSREAALDPQGRAAYP